MTSPLNLPLKLLTMELFSLENLINLFLLTLLQAVLGFDNLLYISLESKRVAAEKQARIRKLGIGLAVILRIILLFIIINLLEKVTIILFSINIPGFIEAKINLHSLIVLAGGAFILYTAVKEITHMLVVDNLDQSEKQPASFTKTLVLIIIMNVVFSFDSILSAIALTQVFAVMATAIIIGGLLMIWLADHVSTFLEKNRMYEVLGLFILFIVGILLLSEGGHLAHLSFFGQAITPMSKATFYFVIATLVIVEIIQTRYSKNLLKQRKQTITH